MTKLTDNELGAIMANQIEISKSSYKQGRQQSHAKELDYFFGKMDQYVPAETNRSSVVSRDVADTIGWLMPQMMRIYTASGRMFVCEPVEPEDVDYADGATDGINHVFWKDNKGYEIVYAGTWDSLLHGDGIVKTFWDDTPIYGPPRFIEGLSDDALALLLQDDSIDVLEKSEEVVAGLDPLGQPVEVTVYSIKARKKRADGKVTVVVIPPEDFLISEATSLEEAAFKAHWERKTRSDLVEMGYDKSEVWALPAASRASSPEGQARSPSYDEDAPDKSMELVDYFECYPVIDHDLDGVAEMLRVCIGGTGTVLDWEVWEDEDPFDNIRCEPIPHRWDSRSVADKEIDVQNVKTVLTRQLLNNTYWVNNPMRFAQGKIKNPEMLQAPDFGAVVFGDTGAVITDLPTAYIGDKALAGINYMDEVSQRRTGVGRQSMALDPETLQNQSATANQNAHDASMAQHEQIARNMAEGWGRVGRKILRLMTRHMQTPRQILVKGEAVQIDPRNWNPDMHVNINTGLGTGSRDRDAQMLNTVLQQQIAFTDRIGASFPEKALDMLPHIHNTLTKFAESAGLKSPELYWPEVTEDEIKQGKQVLAQRAKQPDPKAAQEMADRQAKQQQAQRDHEYRMAQVSAKAASDQRADQLKAQQDAIAAQRAYELKQQEMAANMTLKQQQLEAELVLKERQLISELALQREFGMAKAAGTSDVQPGGEPG